MLSLPTIAATLLALSLSAYAAPIEKPAVELAVVQGSLQKRGESGPEINGVNFPDPSIIGVNGIWYAFATRTKGTTQHVQVAQSRDYVTWTLVTNADGSQKEALPNLPSWVDTSSSTSSNVWAPDVSRLDDGTFVMYYSATVASDPSKHCVGAAKATSITGPYTPTSNTALICPLSEGGAIDASGYNDNGNRYIAWKVDGNSIGHGGACGNTVAPIVATPIKVQALAKDGVTLQGSPTTILNNNGAADQGIVEAPSLAHIGNTWVLFFSNSCFTTNGYTVSYATASSINGPYTRASRPLFQTGDYGLTAPGSADIDHDGKHLLFHANYGSLGSLGSGRALYQAQITLNGKTVSV